MHANSTVAPALSVTVAQKPPATDSKKSSDDKSTKGSIDLDNVKDGNPQLSEVPREA